MDSSLPEIAPSPTDFLREAQKRFRMCADAEAQNRRDALDDLKFAMGEQWPKEIMTQRAADGTPCLTLNQLGKFIRQVCNEQRQQRPAIQVNPVGDGADKDTAEVFQGIIRHIETNSEAEIADDTAFEFAVKTGGPGWIRCVTEYIDDESDDQEIRIVQVPNPFCVYIDPRAQKATREDARFAFVVEDMPREVFEETYPESAIAGLTDYSTIGDAPAEWVQKDAVRVAEYFYCEEKRETRKGKRDRITKTWHWAKITAMDVLEKVTLKGKYLPLFPVYANEINVDGKRHYEGIVRPAKDPQRQYNYHASAATEAIGIGSKAPWIMTKEQVENHEKMWGQANTRKLAYLIYNNVPNSPPPIRNASEPPIQAMMMMVRQSSEDLMSSTGLYNPSLGKQQSPQESGKAILAQQQQGDVATLNFSDNMKRTKKQIGKYLIDQIPYVYDAPRVQRVINPDESTQHVGVYNSQEHQMSPDEVAAMPEMEGVTKIYDLGVGRFDVVVDIGPSYQTKRKEAVATQLELMREIPMVQQGAPDIIIRNMDIPGADAIADRVKKMLPPQLIDDEGQDPETQLHKTQAQLQMLTQQHQLAMQELAKLQDTVKGKVIENQGRQSIEQMKLQSQERMWSIEQQGKIVIAQIEAKTQDAATRAQETLQVWQELHQAAHDTALSQQEHQQTLEQGQQQAAVQSQQMAQQGQQTAQQSAQDAAQANQSQPGE